LVGCAAKETDPRISIDLTERGGGGAFPNTAINVASIAERCGPAVVVVIASTKQGSGVILPTGRHVVTNAHVIEGEKEVELRLSDGRSLKSRVSSVDAQADLAILILPQGSYTPAQLGEHGVRVGEDVVAIGAPLGLEQTVSAGIVSALRGPDDATTVIQISVPISPGSSGGGLFDRRGRLIGITTASLAKGQNLNFAMPVSMVRSLLSRTEQPSD
jgi:S1-C subfamily serine protease